jgi:hypothetical protein
MLRKAMGGLLGAAIVVALLLVVPRDGPGLLAAGKRQGPQGILDSRTEPAHAVLYSVHRGPYQTLGQTFRKLLKLARTRRIVPTGADGIAVYLKSDDAAEEADLLTCVQIPVSMDALRQKGRLQKIACAMKLGTTDVKLVPERVVFFATKEMGNNDPGDLYGRLQAMIQSQAQGALTCPPEQRFPDASRIPDSCELSDLTTELMVPLQRGFSPPT